MKSEESADVLVTYGFTESDSILLSPLFHKLWDYTRMKCCPSYSCLEDTMLEGRRQGLRHIFVANGCMDFYLLDVALKKAASCGGEVAAVIFLGGVLQLSLDAAVKADVPIILADLEREDELSECARGVRSGKPYRSKSVYASNRRELEDFPEHWEQLSENEKICCALLLSNASQQEIASCMHIASSTAGTYISRVYRKFSVDGRVSLLQCFAGRNA